MQFDFQPGSIQFPTSLGQGYANAVGNVGAARAGAVDAVSAQVGRIRQEAMAEHQKQQQTRVQKEAEKQAMTLLGGAVQKRTVRMGEYAPFSTLAMSGSDDEAGALLANTFGLDGTTGMAMSAEMRRSQEVEVADPVVVAQAYRQLVAAGFEPSAAKAMIESRVGEAYSGENGLREAMSKRAQDSTAQYLKTKDPTLVQREIARRDEEAFQSERKLQGLQAIGQMAEQPGAVERVSMIDFSPEGVAYRGEVDRAVADQPELAMIGGMDAATARVQELTQRQAAIQGMTPEERAKNGGAKLAFELRESQAEIENISKAVETAREQALESAFEAISSGAGAEKYPSVASFERELIRQGGVTMDQPVPQLAFAIEQGRILYGLEPAEIERATGLSLTPFRAAERVIGANRGPGGTNVTVNTGSLTEQSSRALAEHNARAIAGGRSPQAVIPDPPTDPGLVGSHDPKVRQVLGAQKMLAQKGAYEMDSTGRITVTLGDQNRTSALPEIALLEEAVNIEGSRARADALVTILGITDGTPTAKDREMALEVFQSMMATRKTGGGPGLGGDTQSNDEAVRSAFEGL
jgi:hypothetical protein